MQSTQSLTVRIVVKSLSKCRKKMKMNKKRISNKNRLFLLTTTKKIDRLNVNFATEDLDFVLLLVVMLVRHILVEVKHMSIRREFEIQDN